MKFVIIVGTLQLFLMFFYIIVMIYGSTGSPVRNATVVIYLLNKFLFFTICLILYVFYNIQMIFMMYRKHNLAFKSHAIR